MEDQQQDITESRSLEDGDLPTKQEDAEQQPSIVLIKKKLSSVGLTDEVLVQRSGGSGGRWWPKTEEKRRSRSYGDLFVCEKQLTAPKLVPKKSLRNLPAATGRETRPIGLEELKKNLINEIKNKLVEQIESKKTHQMEVQQILDTPTELWSQDPITQHQERSTKGDLQSAILSSEKLLEAERNHFKLPEPHACTKNDNEIIDKNQIKLEPSSPAVVDNGSSSGTPTVEPKRFSISSLNGVELRKPYSPVYERTRKIVRVSNNGINRWSTSQPQVQQRHSGSSTTRNQPNEQPLTTITSKGELETETALNSQVVNVDVVSQLDQSTVQSTPISSLQSLTSSRMETAIRNLTTTPNNTTDREFFPSQQNFKVNSSYPRISKTSANYSAHPSVYVIERDAEVPFDARSERSMGMSSTLRRGASFKGLKRNLKKTFSSQLTVLTLEKVEKAPESNIPMIVVCCIETLRMKGLLKTEGLYRSSPSQMEVRKVIKYARKGQYDYVKHVDDPVVLAGTLKSFFFTLKTHIISQELMEKSFPKRCLIGDLTEQEQVERLKILVSDLDTIHYDTLEYLIKHLQEVASYSKFNLMTPPNLGVVWAPCLFTTCDKTMHGADLLSFMGQQTRLMDLLITKCDLLFDRYMIDEITLAIEDGYSAESIQDEPIDLRPNFEINGENEIVKRKLLRNLSVTLDNRYNNNGSSNVNGKNGANYELQTSSTMPIVSGAGKRNGVKRQRNRTICLLS